MESGIKNIAFIQYDYYSYTMFWCSFLDGSNQDSSTEKILRLLLDTVMSVKQQADGEFKQLMEQQEPDEEENNHQVIRATYRIFYHQDRFQMEDLYKSMYIQNTARNNRWFSPISSH